MFNPLEIVSNLPIVGTGTKAIVKTAETAGMVRGLKKGFIVGTVTTAALTSLAAAAVLVLQHRSTVAEKAGETATKAGKTAAKAAKAAAKAAVGSVRSDADAAPADEK